MDFLFGAICQLAERQHRSRKGEWRRGIALIGMVFASGGFALCVFHSDQSLSGVAESGLDARQASYRKVLFAECGRREP